MSDSIDAAASAPTTVPGFDVLGARKEGYSDGEIATFLAKQTGFDLNGARKEGYKDPEIVGFLAPPPAPSSQATSAVPPATDTKIDPYDLGGDMAAQPYMRGMQLATPEAMGRVGAAAVKGFTGDPADTADVARRAAGESALNDIPIIGPLNQHIVTPALKLAGGALAGAGAAVSQAVMEYFGDKLGREVNTGLAILPEAQRLQVVRSMGLGGLKAPGEAAPASEAPPLVAPEVRAPQTPLEMARDLRADRSATQTTQFNRILELIRDDGTSDRGVANQSLVTAPQSVIAAPTLDSAITAAQQGIAGVTPYKPVTVGEVAARDGLTDPNEAYRRMVAENAGGVGIPDYFAMRDEAAPAAPTEVVQAPTRRLPGIYGGEPDVTTGPFDFSASPSPEAPGRALVPTKQPALTGEIMPPGTDVVPRASSTEVPGTSAAAKQIAGQWYQRVDELGADYSPAIRDKFLDYGHDISQEEPEVTLGRGGPHPVEGYINKLEETRGNPISLKAIQGIDEQLGDMIDAQFNNGRLSSEGRLLFNLQTHLRELAANAEPADVEGGIEGYNALKNARLAYSQAMKMRDVERINDRASMMEQPSTGIKTGIRTLLSNPSRVRGYTPEEIAVLKTAATRGMVGDLFHVFGSRLLPLVGFGAGFGSGVLGSVIGAGVGQGLATGMRAGATALQTRRLNNAMTTLGERVPAPPQ